jgi:hypothetical protein
MPLSEKDYIRGKHPLNCNCTKCVSKRSGINTPGKSPRNKSSRIVRIITGIIFFFTIILVGGVLFWTSAINKESRMNNPVSIPDTTASVTPTTSPTSPTTPPPTKKTGINDVTGEYKNYYLGLVKTTEGVITGKKCYGEFIVLINNRNATNPTYSELLNFLSSDNTDEYSYSLSISAGGIYFGNEEDMLDLELIQNIIDGTAHPKNPKICSDFAERLHNNAEMAGIRCGFIALDSPDHALNVFETTDKGLVYIDDTGSFLFGPDNCDKVVNLKEGAEYIPVSLFPEYGWKGTWDSMGIVSGVFVTWDGEWRD